jgi:hypothetical protein
MGDHDPFAIVVEERGDLSAAALLAHGPRRLFLAQFPPADPVIGSPDASTWRRRSGRWLSESAVQAGGFEEFDFMRGSRVEQA